ncbi:hypothetical protein O6H91_Y527800 [Diphasiastrum complanatum]|nr:hypothetical protein O6H91_Y527800 [Diphasiastrum complanatum]
MHTQSRKKRSALCRTSNRADVLFGRWIINCQGVGSYRCCNLPREFQSGSDSHKCKFRFFHLFKGLEFQTFPQSSQESPLRQSRHNSSGWQSALLSSRWGKAQCKETSAVFDLGGSSGRPLKCGFDKEAGVMISSNQHIRGRDQKGAIDNLEVGSLGIGSNKVHKSRGCAPRKTISSMQGGFHTVQI